MAGACAAVAVVPHLGTTRSTARGKHQRNSSFTLESTSLVVASTMMAKLCLGVVGLGEVTVYETDGVGGGG